jgi:predicted dehydrogenase
MSVREGSLAVSRNVRLRVGVIGLGRLWEARHKPALARLSDRFRVSAVYDQVTRRAELEATGLRCAVCEGLAALIERPDVDVVYLMTPQWFGLYPAELACDAGKPIYCALPVSSDPEALESLATRLRSAGTPFMPELARRFYPVTLRLRELLATRLGRPRLVLGQSRLSGFDRYGHPGPTTQLAPVPLTIDPGSYLLDWCRFLFGSEPVSVQGFGGSILPSSDRGTMGPDFESFAAEFDHGELAQIAFGRYHRSAWGEASRFLPQPGFQVFAERGVAWLEMPERIQWTDAEGIHEERLPLEPTVGEVLNDQFYRLVHGEQSLAPSIDDALAVARLVNDLQESRREGRKILRRGLPERT